MHLSFSARLRSWTPVSKTSLIIQCRWTPTLKDAHEAGLYICFAKRVLKSNSLLPLLNQFSVYRSSERNLKISNVESSALYCFEPSEVELKVKENNYFFINRTKNATLQPETLYKAVELPVKEPINQALWACGRSFSTSSRCSSLWSA